MRRRDHEVGFVATQNEALLLRPCIRGMPRIASFMVVRTVAVDDDRIRGLLLDAASMRVRDLVPNPAAAIARATTRRIARLRSGANVACATAAAGFESLLLVRGELWRRAVHASQVSQAAPSGGVTENQRDDQQH